MKFSFQLILVFVLLISCNETVDPKPLIPVKNQEPKITLSYSEVRSSIDSNRISLRNEFLNGDTHKDKVALEKAGNRIRQIIGQELYEYWQGTPWGFNGITKTPKQGSIACGYFVTRMLLDAGYKLNQIKLSTCPSLAMMKELTSSKSIRNISSLDYDEFTNLIKSYGKALFIVGLDFHTGFIMNDGNEVWFIHSNYIMKAGVMRERVEESVALESSKTRYITCLSNNEKFLRSWILN